MIKVDANTEFFPDGEQITSIPKSFALLAESHNSYLYGSGKNGRQVEWVYDNQYGWGWRVTKVEVDQYDCCGSS